VNEDWIRPDWPAPAWVRACTTTRDGGVSRGPFASFNLAAHVGDVPAAVQANRARLAAVLRLPAAPRWLSQVHGTTAVDGTAVVGECAADAVYARSPGVVCAVLTADCLPVLLCDRAGTRVAAVHAGWRGLADGVLERAMDALGGPPGELLAWLGPAISGEAYEVGEEVRVQFLRQGSEAESAAFRPSAAGRWLADLYQLARLRLRARGVAAVHGGRWCTYNQPEQFFSFRRDGITGRMATLIWLEAR
jgi:YfiH family protein